MAQNYSTKRLDVQNTPLQVLRCPQSNSPRSQTALVESSIVSVVTAESGSARRAQVRYFTEVFWERAIWFLMYSEITDDELLTVEEEYGLVPTVALNQKLKEVLQRRAQGVEWPDGWNTSSAEWPQSESPNSGSAGGGMSDKIIHRIPVSPEKHTDSRPTASFWSHGKRESSATSSTALQKFRDIGKLRGKRIEGGGGNSAPGDRMQPEPPECREFRQSRDQVVERYTGCGRIKGKRREETQGAGGSFPSCPRVKIRIRGDGISSSAGKVRFGSGSGPFALNAEPERGVRFGQLPNLEPEHAFRFSSAFERVRT
ncbi:hypothetical protein C8R44DRAFT_733132 [Mycena epipterygia]|nr:hypothetical protein C8R44DRAFT_733132 [Mycena epipterygia]